MTDHKSAKDDKKMLKRQRREDSQVHSGSIHALLVMEMQQQQDQTTERGATSHKNPRTLLASDFIYRMFDPP